VLQVWLILERLGYSSVQKDGAEKSRFGELSAAEIHGID